MKIGHSFILAGLASIALQASAPAKSTAAPPSSENTGTTEPCGNPDVSGTPICRECEDNVWNTFLPAAGSSCDANSIRAYNGNAHRQITDLRIAGSVGNTPLAFTRYSNTRLSGRNLAHSAFGSESSWSHNFEWVMRDNGGTAERPIIKITYPKGDEMRFQRTSATATTWLPVNHRNPDRVIATGDDFVLHTRHHEKYGFKRRFHSVTGGVFYRLETLTDSASNTHTLTYLDNDDTLIRQITDPAGHWIKLHYQDIALRDKNAATLATELLPAGSTNVWKEIQTTPGKSFRILALHQGNTWRQKMPLRVAELEFYDENNVKITGAKFGSWPWTENNLPYRAFDNNTATYYEYQYNKAGYVGIDLGPGNAKQVSRIRYRLTGTLNSDASVTFVGMNTEAVPSYVVSHIEGSDGREVGYDYNVHTEPAGIFQWVQLTDANYPDLTAASYQYKWQHRHIMPVLEKAHDPRYDGAIKKVRYGYNISTTVIGFVTDEFDDVTGQPIVSVRWDGGHIPKLVYPNGKAHRFEYTNGNLARAINTFGGVTDYTYTADGYVLTEDDPLGRTTTYTRNQQGHVLSVTTPGGSVTSVIRDSEHHITSITRNGKTTSHTLDPATKLRTRTDHPDGTYETWTHTPFGQPLTHRLRNGITETWTYSPNGLKKTHTDAIGAVTHYHHYGDTGYPVFVNANTANVTGRLAAVIDPHGNTTTFSYNDRGQITREVRTPGGNIAIGAYPVQNTDSDHTLTTDHTYDDYGNLIGRTIHSTDPVDPGRLWFYQYDSLGRLIREEDPLGRVTLTRYSLGGSNCGSCATSAKPLEIEHPDGTITRFEYDKEWRLLATTRAFGTPEAATTRHTYNLVGQRITTTNPTGRITRYSYDLDGRVLSEIQGYGTPLAATTSHTYNLDGDRLTTTDPVGAITRTTYNLMRRPITVTHAWNTPLATTTTYHYEAATGRLTSIKDNINRVTTFRHDALDRVIKTEFPDGNFTETFFDLLGRAYATRDLLGNFPSQVFNSRGQPLARTDAAGITTTAAYNGQGHLTLTSLPSGKSVAYQHDLLGNTLATILAPGTDEQTVISEILTRDAMLRPLTVRDGEGTITTMNYDPLGRLLFSSQNTGNLNLKTSYTYHPDGQLHTVKAPDNLVTTTRTYDALGRLKTETDGKNQTLTYHYDLAGRKTAYTDAKGATFSFQYDLLGRLTKRTEPDFTFQTYTYDAAGRLHIHTKADGKTKTHHYENPHRDELSRITYSNGDPQRTYTYTAVGQLETAANAHSTITHGYDPAGRKTAETQALTGGPTGTFTYQYDLDGQLARHTRPDGSFIDYQYNARNLLASVISDAPPPVAEYTYNGRNQLEDTVFENGLFTATRAYDDAGRLTGITNGTLDSTGYVLTPDGRRDTITRNGIAETYGYDNARQVTNATYGGLSLTQSWNYDPAGNRLNATTNSITTNYQANLVNEYISISGGGFQPPSPTYDPNGNTLNLPRPDGTALTLAWNINNELITATNGNGDTAQYSYDALGRRIKTTTLISNIQSQISFFYNGWNVELEYEGSVGVPPALVRRHTWGLDLSQTLQGAGGVGGLVMSEDLPPGPLAPIPHFPTYDGNGNITAWVNASGTVVARQRYDAFGNIIQQTGTAPSNYGFSTKPMDQVTGLLYYGYRYYDPVTGRWPSRDPIGESGGMNLYGFVGNNGVDMWDVLGLDATGEGDDLSPCDSCECLEFYLQERNLSAMGASNPLGFRADVGKGPDLNIPEDGGSIPSYKQQWHGAKWNDYILRSRWKNTDECKNCCKDCLKPVVVRWRSLGKYSQQFDIGKKGLKAMPLFGEQEMNASGCSAKYLKKTYPSGIQEIGTIHGHAHVPAFARFPLDAEFRLTITYKGKECLNVVFKQKEGKHADLGVFRARGGVNQIP